MTIREIVGALLLASPFIGLFTYMAWEGDGWFALALFGGVALLLAVMFAGSYLLFGST